MPALEQDAFDRLAAELVSEIEQRAENARVALRRVFLGHAQHERNDVGRSSRSARAATVGPVVLFATSRRHQRSSVSGVSCCWNRGPVKHSDRSYEHSNVLPPTAAIIGAIRTRPFSANAGSGATLACAAAPPQNGPMPTNVRARSLNQGAGAGYPRAVSMCSTHAVTSCSPVVSTRLVAIGGICRSSPRMPIRTVTRLRAESSGRRS